MKNTVSYLFWFYKQVFSFWFVSRTILGTLFQPSCHSLCYSCLVSSCNVLISVFPHFSLSFVQVLICFMHTWIDGPVFFFLAFLRLGSAGVRRDEEKKESKHQHFFCTGMPDFLFYLEFEVVIRRFTFTSRKGNQLFSNFPLHIYFKERDKVLKCRERRFCLICRERQFCAVEGDFVP